MTEATMVPSIASTRDEIGARAARHLDTTFRAVMRPPAAEHQRDFMRIITGELHPMGNAAIVSNPNDLAVTQTAAVPLRESGLPAIVLFTEGVTAEAAKTLEAMGFADDGAMPAMAVDIDAMGDTALPAGYTWARVGAGGEGSAWASALAAGYAIPIGLARLFSPDAAGRRHGGRRSDPVLRGAKDGEPVATSLLLLADGLAGIYSVSTLAAERDAGSGRTQRRRPCARRGGSAIASACFSRRRLGTPSI